MRPAGYAAEGWLFGGAVQMIKVHIEPAGTEDIPALLSIQKDAFRRLYEIYRDENSPYLKNEDQMRSWMDNPAITYRKIFADGELCGGIAYFRRSPGDYYLARVYIHPDFQRKGIAAEAIRQCELLFSDAVKFSLDFPIDQPANRMCYEKAGYKDTGKRIVINEKLTLAVYEKEA